MELTERKVKILQAVIRNYLETGEPVGSRTISKYTDLNLSSATIRNEMADLEEMGYIVQPHTSAGRIPTDKGYRLYVDDLMKEKVQELDNREKKVTERENLLFEKVDKVETLLQNMAKMLATNTNYATMISTSRDNEDKIKFIQLSLMDDNQILCIVVSGRNRVVNKIIKVKDQINEEMVLRLNVALNTSLAGLAVEQINIAVISTLTSNAGEHKELVTADAEITALAQTPKEEIPAIIKELRKPKKDRKAKKPTSPEKSDVAADDAPDSNEVHTEDEIVPVSNSPPDFKRSIQGHKRCLTDEDRKRLRQSIDNRHHKTTVANGSIMMCEVQGAKEDFIRRWNLVFKDYPDVFEDNDCQSVFILQH